MSKDGQMGLKVYLFGRSIIPPTENVVDPLRNLII